MSQSYPKELPLTEIQDIVKLVRSGTAGPNKDKFAKDVWIVTGYVLGQTVGETVDSRVMGAANKHNSPHSIAECCDHLDDLIGQHNSQVMGAAKLDWSTIMVFLKPILKQALEILIGVL